MARLADPLSRHRTDPSQKVAETAQSARSARRARLASPDGLPAPATIAESIDQRD